MFANTCMPSVRRLACSARYSVRENTLNDCSFKIHKSSRHRLDLFNVNAGVQGRGALASNATYTRMSMDSITSPALTRTVKRTGLGLFRQLLIVPRKYPIAFGAVFSGLKTAFADVLVQTQVEGKDWETLDRRRVGVFGAFGLIYQGWFQYYVYVKFMGRVLWPRAGNFARKSLAQKLKDRKGCRDLVQQIAFDQLLYMPFVWYSSFYIFKEAIMNDAESLRAVVRNGLREHSNNFKEDVLMSWKIWIPCNMINFAFMPLWGRIPFMATCSFAFCIVISLNRGKPADEEEQELSE